MFQIKKVEDLETAIRVGDFIIGPNAFDQTWAPNEKEFVKQAPIDSLKNEHHVYFYVEDGDQIIGVAGVRENKYGSDGYEMDQDYIAVHKNYRHQGIASQLIAEVENYVLQNHGRYLHVLTCDIDSYAAARAFYEKHGYAKVAQIPDYYVVGEGRIDYLKKF